MKLHANAPLGPKGRAIMVRRVLEEGIALTEAAEAAGVSARTAGKWVRHYRAEGEAGLFDRSSAPHNVHNATPADRVEAIAALRRLRLTGPEIAELLEMATSTVSAVLKRIGLGKLSCLAPPEPIRRYERHHPGELIHIDVKKLGRISAKGAGHGVTGKRNTQIRRGADGALRTGWKKVHACIDDATRLAYVEVLANEKAATAIGFLKRALAFYASHGIEVQRLMTDNGSPYVSVAHALACRALGIRPAHAALPTPDLWQGRAVHSHNAPRVGLRRRLWELSGEDRGALWMGGSATTSGDDTAPLATGRR